MKRITALLAGAALMMLATSALAKPITGTINFTGSEILAPVGTTLDKATGMDFKNAEVHGLSTGTYAAIDPDTPVTFVNYVGFNPSSIIGSIPAFWSLVFAGNTFSFDLETIKLDYQTATHLDLSGTGILHAVGFDATPGTWYYSTQGSGPTTFSATSDAIPAVPEPGTLVLLGAGFFGLAIFAKRSKNNETSCAA